MLTAMGVRIMIWRFNPLQAAAVCHSSRLKKKSPETVEIPRLFDDFDSRSALAESPYLFGDCRALPKTPGKTEMVLRFPLGFA